jgi:hypothetical protein
MQAGDLKKASRPALEFTRLGNAQRLKYSNECSDGVEDHILRGFQTLCLDRGYDQLCCRALMLDNRE